MTLPPTAMIAADGSPEPEHHSLLLPIERHVGTAPAELMQVEVPGLPTLNDGVHDIGGEARQS